METTYTYITRRYKELGYELQTRRAFFQLSKVQPDTQHASDCLQQRAELRAVLAEACMALPS